MDQVSIRDLRNRGGEVVDRVAAGDRVTVTRDGVPVAELRPVARPPLGAAAVIERWRRLPRVDLAALRRDVDDALDARL